MTRAQLDGAKKGISTQRKIGRLQADFKPELIRTRNRLAGGTRSQEAEKAAIGQGKTARTSPTGKSVATSHLESRILAML